MTTFYSFNSRAEFTSNGGLDQSDYMKDSIDFSVIGEQFDENEEVVEFLVNTSKPVDGWEDYQCWPTSPMRIFG